MNLTKHGVISLARGGKCTNTSTALHHRSHDNICKKNIENLAQVGVTLLARGGKYTNTTGLH